MWQQVSAIAWAQFRIMRNHLPRTSFGTVLTWFVSLLWYGLYLGLSVTLAVTLPYVELPDLREWLPVGLLAVFLFWQIVPLITVSAGWSLQLNKLQAYPVSNGALFAIEVLLRFTTAPEMILVLAGGAVGLLRHQDVPGLLPLFLLLFIPFNLFLSLGIRELLLHSFERNRFRELFAILGISIGVIPQLLARTGLGRMLAPYFFGAARNVATPWREVARLSLGPVSVLDIGLMLMWTGLCYALARWQFETGLRQDSGFRVRALVRRRPEQAAAGPSLSGWVSHGLRDPTAALLQKELRSLPRMPRFRVMFGMACVFSLVFLVPTFGRNGHDEFVRNNFLPLATLYGLLLLSDSLLFNVFGFDRTAAQLYLVAPVPLAVVLKAKNLAAVTFIVLQAMLTLLLAAALRFSFSLFNILTAFMAVSVVSVFFLSIGNISSIMMARPMDPTQTFRKQAGGKMQFWFLLSSLGMFALLGFAYLAGWALNTRWAVVAVLLIEFGIGLIVYRIALQSAVERGSRLREKLVEALSRGTSPVSLGS